MAKSTILIAVLVSVICGIFFGNFFVFDFWWEIGIFVGLVISLVIFWKNPIFKIVLFIFAGFLLGISYSQTFDTKQREIEVKKGEQTTIGQIIGLPEYSGASAKYLLKVDRYNVQLTTARYPEFEYGDILQFSGKIQPSNDYLYYQRILGQVYNPDKLEKIGEKRSLKTKFVKNIYKVKFSFENALGRAMAEPLASFGAGLVFGSKAKIPDSLMSDFNRTGTTHIVAVSGYNVTIIVVNLSILFGLISRRFKFWAAILLIVGFVIMTGASASVVRAGILSALISWGRFEGRRINQTILLTLVCVVMLLFNPYKITHDISFELSFLAFAGLVYLAPIISKIKFFKFLPQTLRTIFAETLSAQIMVLPILIYFFGNLSLISPLVNVMILPFVPLAMLIVFVIGAGSLIVADLGQILAIFGQIILKYIIGVVENFSRFSFAAYQLKTASWWWIVIFYGLIGLYIIKNRQKLLKTNEENF